MLDIVCEEHVGWQRQAPYASAEYTIGGGTCPFLFDDEGGERRPATKADCVETFNTTTIRVSRARGEATTTRIWRACDAVRFAAFMSNRSRIRHSLTDSFSVRISSCPKLLLRDST